MPTALIAVLLLAAAAGAVAVARALRSRRFVDPVLGAGLAEPPPR